MLYFDTNVFVYAADITSEHHHNAVSLLHQTTTQKLPFTTSVETIQEIIHVYKKLHRLKYGLKICQNILKLIPQPLSVDKTIISQYLKVTSQYPKLESRDCLHIAICRVHSIPILITQDKALARLKITRLQIQTPTQLLKALKSPN